jgi:hypothetical protein
MSTLPEDDTAGQELASGIAKLPVELKCVILEELTVYPNDELALELVAKSSVFKEWSVHHDAHLNHIHNFPGLNLLSIAS